MYYLYFTDNENFYYDFKGSEEELKEGKLVKFSEKFKLFQAERECIKNRENYKHCFILYSKQGEFEYYMYFNVKDW